MKNKLIEDNYNKKQQLYILNWKEMDDILFSNPSGMASPTMIFFLEYEHIPDAEDGMKQMSATIKNYVRMDKLSKETQALIRHELKLDINDEKNNPDLIGEATGK